MKGGKYTYFIFFLGKYVDKLLDGLLSGVVRTILPTDTLKSVIASDKVAIATFLAHANRTLIRLTMGRSNCI